MNLNTLLVVLTLASVWVVSQKLTSTRPASSAGELRAVMGEQSLEARLWEDPFKTPGRPTKGDGLLAPDLTTLSTQIQRRVSGHEGVLILPVMISGGPYSEDQEDRIRSRFAIASALGQSGYVPRDAEHIGSAILPWPTTQRLNALKETFNKAAEANPQPSLAEFSKQAIPGVDESATPPLDLRYEWYYLQSSSVRGTPVSNSTNDTPVPHVLVLWLNQRDFEDEPLLRLPLLLAPITAAVSKAQAMHDPLRVALIGPRRSSTLLAMLPKRETGEVPLRDTYPHLWHTITAILEHVDVYSATARAMDAIFVRTHPDDDPRARIREQLTQHSTLKTIRFKSFHNFAATDEQLAQDMLDELELRGVDFTNPDTHNHLVLISEWDNFYTQMLALTYAAELVKRQHPGDHHADWVQQYFTAPHLMPNQRLHQIATNLSSFVYLRGLDGQTYRNDARAPRNAGSEDAPRSSPTSLDDLRKWTPDANKAEGPAQFDYLSRLGEHLADLEKQLSKERKHIKAIGVVGSDVYDTLLILQALRHQFSDALFFTTDLDARFWHPREQAWSRNVLVTSGYGLQLQPALQGSIPPFRDSVQTAQFAAALAALGQSELRPLTCIPPRRFEIAKRGAVDLSPPPRRPSCLASEGLLHPSTRISASTWIIAPRTWGVLCVIGLTVVLLVTCYYEPLWRLTWGAAQLRAETLLYREEDVGGIEGACTLVWCLQQSAQAPKECWSQWLVDELKSVPLAVSYPWPASDAALQEKQRGGRTLTHDSTVFLDRIHRAQRSIGKAKEDAPHEIDRCKEALLRGVIASLNRLLQRPSLPPGQAITPPGGLPDPLEAAWQYGEPAQPGPPLALPISPQQLYQRRAFLDAWLQHVVEASHTKEVSLQSDTRQAHPRQRRSAAPHTAETSVEQATRDDILHQTQAARLASLKLYALQRRGVWQCWMLAVAMGILATALGGQIWWDTFHNTSGEPFSLTTGTSAWPAEILRAAALALALSFCFQAYHTLQTMRFQLTRRFRLPLASATPSPQSERQPLSRLPGERGRPWPRFKPRVALLLHWWSRTWGLPAPPRVGAVVSAGHLRQAYQQYGRFPRRLGRILCLFLPYFGCCVGLWWLSQQALLPPLRGPAARIWDAWLLRAAVGSGLFLTFMTMDAARLCRWFIRALSEAPTEYPLATTDHFSRLRGDVERRYLDEWIDLQLIADLTDRVGRLVYYPSIVFFLLLLARNEWWDRWSWPWALILIFVFNLILAATSIIILQNAARKAKQEAEASLEAKVKRLQAATADNPVQNNAQQAEKLLEEIRNLRRGAFVPLWENPVLGALLLPSGGTALLQMLVWFMGR